MFYVVDESGVVVAVCRDDSGQSRTQEVDRLWTRARQATGIEDFR